MRTGKCSQTIGPWTHARRCCRLELTDISFCFCRCFLLPSCSCSWPFLLSLLALWRTATPRNVQLPRLEEAPSSHSNSMAVKDGTGLRATACRSLKLQLAIFLLLPLLTPQNVQLPRLQKSAFATLQHHGSEGRNGPPGDGLYCLTSPSEATRNKLSFGICRCFLLPSSSCSWPSLPSLLALAAWWPRLETFSCQGSKKAPSPHSNSVAVKGGTGLRATTCTA